MTVSAPFPWFGGKRKVAAEVWTRFGAEERTENGKRERIWFSPACLKQEQGTLFDEIIGNLA